MTNTKFYKVSISLSSDFNSLKRGYLCRSSIMVQAGTPGYVHLLLHPNHTVTEMKPKLRVLCSLDGGGKEITWQANKFL